MSLTQEQTNNLTLACSASVAAERTTGCPAELTVAQWALESGWGKHVPPESNNPFGIKARPGEPRIEATTLEVIHGKPTVIRAGFRKFDSLLQAFEQHGMLIATGAPYGAAFEQWEKDKDLPGLISGVARRYATDPHYSEELLGVIRMPVVVAALATMRKPV